MRCLDDAALSGLILMSPRLSCVVVDYLQMCVVEVSTENSENSTIPRNMYREATFVLMGLFVTDLELFQYGALLGSMFRDEAHIFC